ncbi:MAG: hypothetical protein K2G28_11820 [Acetatifactor sp.]|nr:hypothetical protein [Acetatifactor sp.]
MGKGYKLGSALCVNAIIVVLEIVDLVISLTDQGMMSFTFYTQDSNYLAMAVSLMFCVYAVRELRGKSEVPNWIYSMRYITVSCLMVTFFVVIFVLMPMMEENAFAMLYEGSMLYQHTLCPLLSAFSLFAFEAKNALPRAALVKALIPTLTYALIAVTLNIFKIINGPYPFLIVYSQPVYMSALWCIIIMGIAGILALAVWSLYNFSWKKKQWIKKRL